MNPFALQGPAYVSFSMGETSGLMLARCLDAGLGPDVHVCLMNTGKEDERSLAFGHRIETEWGVPIRWLERTPGGGFREVTYETANRDGEPFRTLNTERGMVPNPASPFCSTELKGRVAKSFMESLGYDDRHTAIGMRFDEPGRVAKASGKKVEGGWVEHPLHAARLTKADVNAFWATQPFRLGLEPHEGNCDLCFKKAQFKRIRILENDITKGDFWVEEERRTGTRHHADRASATELQTAVRRQVRLPLLAEDGSIPCGCTE